MTDLAKLAESLTPCHYALSNYVTCQTAAETARCPWAGCPLERRPAILAALTLSHAAGVNAGLEMAAKWHEGRSEILQVRAQQFADEGNNDSARLLDVAARDHRESAASIRALKSPSKETEHE